MIGQRCVNKIWKAAKSGNASAINIIFGVLDNDHEINDIVCTYRGGLQLAYITLKAKDTIFAHINNSELAKRLEEQDMQSHPNWDVNDDESKSPL